jgi:hypothetical protein
MRPTVALRASVGSTDASWLWARRGAKSDWGKMMDAKSGQGGFTDGGAWDVLRDDNDRHYVIDDGERVSRIWIDPNPEHDRPVVVSGSPS